MKKIQIDNEDFIIYSPDSLKYITDKMIDILNESLSFYKELFGVSKFRKIQINYFDNIDNFREFIYSLRGEKESLPQYAKATFDQEMINAFIEPNILIDSPLYNKKIHLASHELFHIMYKELVWEKEYKDRIVWFDEGMAQLFSGENKNLLNDEFFIKWLNEVIETTKEIPDLNKLTHGSEFETEKYSGYKLSLLAVKYLYDSLSFDEFKELIKNPDVIERLGLNIIEKAINYYNENMQISKKNI